MTKNTTKTQMVRSYLSRNYGKANKRLVNRDKFVSWASTEGIQSNTALNALYLSGYHLSVQPSIFDGGERIGVTFTSAQSRALNTMSTRDGISRTEIIRNAVASSLGL